MPSSGFSDPDVASWGKLISDGRKVLRTDWTVAFLPGVMILITVLSVSLLRGRGSTTRSTRGWPASDLVLSIRDLSVRSPEGADRPFAVSNLSLDLFRDEVLCIVGESGSGKSVDGRLDPASPAAAAHGDRRQHPLRRARYRDLADGGAARTRGARIGMIFP